METRPVEAMESSAVHDEQAEEIFAAPEPVDADAPMSDSPIEEARREAADESITGSEPMTYQEERPPDPEFQPRREERRDFQPASPASVTEAIDEVNRIITSLKQVLDQMEEVLETLELAEVQKTADEREIQSLRNSLRQLDRRGPEPRSSEPQEQPVPYQSQGRPQQRHDPRRRHRR